MTRYLLAVLVSGALFAGSPAAAQASSGTISHAFANESWTQGTFAGSVTWTECGSGPCSWLPIATAQPALPEYRCLGDEALDSDPNTQVVWNGGGQNANRTVNFDVRDAAILSGVRGQRLCLSVIETRQIRDPVCVAQAPVLGMDPNDCPFIDQITGHVMATKLFEVREDQAPTPPPSGEQETGAAEQSLTKRTATRAAKRGLGRKFGKRFRKAKRRRIRCKKRGESFLCKVSWIHKSRRYKGTVKVTVEGKATVKVRRRRIR